MYEKLNKNIVRIILKDLEQKEKKKGECGGGAFQ